eukprot:753972-Hanusia_phi.AAC.9
MIPGHWHWHRRSGPGPGVTAGRGPGSHVCSAVLPHDGTARRLTVRYHSVPPGVRATDDRHDCTIGRYWHA